MGSLENGSDLSYESEQKGKLDSAQNLLERKKKVTIKSKYIL